MIGQLLLGGGEPLVICDAADFNLDYMTRGGLTGAVDSKLGILSFWLRIDGGNFTPRYYFTGLVTAGGTDRRIHVIHNTLDDTIDLVITDSDGSGTFLLLSTASSYAASATWHHFLYSWDQTSTPACSLHVTDADDLGSPVLRQDFAADFTLGEWTIGALVNGPIRMNGALAEFYFAPAQYLDFSIVANRRKFISGGGKPVFLGSDGSLPTGIAPLVYQHLADGEAVANFATNRGSGGNFAISGTLDTASTSPSD